MVTLFKPVQSLNARSPISVTLFGMVTLFKLVQPLNAPSPIFLTLLGITYDEPFAFG